MTIQERELEDESTELVAVVAAHQIHSPLEYKEAGHLLVEAKRLQAKVESTFKPIIESIKKSMEEAKNSRAVFMDPLTKAEGVLKSKMLAWDNAERARIEVETATRDKANALSVELDGEPLPAIQTTMAQADGVSFRENWSAQVIDLMALVQAVASGSQPLELLIPNQPRLNELSRSLHAELRIPGVISNMTRSTVVRC